MRALLVTSTLALVAASRETTGIHAVWSAWKASNGKTFSAAEDAERLQYFSNNIDEINRLNRLHANVEDGARFGLNRFAAYSPEELATLRRTRVPPRDSLGFRKAATLPTGGATSADWRTSGIVAPIKDQGFCGSCWAFSANANIEARWALAKKLTAPILLSEQALVDCDHECGDYRGMNGCDGGCDGGLMPNSFKYVIENGLPLQSEYPYTGRDGTCRSGFTSSVNISTWEFIDEDEAQIAAYVAENGPVAVAVDASQWSFYIGGIMTYLCWGTTTMNDLNHGVAIVGFDNAASTPYWIIRNSWGSWGESGYARILYGQKFCGIQLFACSVVV